VKRPAVLVVAGRTIRKNRPIDYVGARHLELLMQQDVLPVIVPIVDGTLKRLPQYAGEMRGLLLVEGQDIEPSRYAAEKANLAYLENTLPERDEIEIRLLRNALRRGLPVLGICRGSQLLNVVCGGTLYGDVQKEKQSDLKHIDQEHYDTHRHSISIEPGTPLERWYRRKALPVSSYHHQGIRQLAKRFLPMAHAPDGLVEGYFDPHARFLVGLQFHPERMPEETESNARLWREFSETVHGRRRALGNVRGAA
jgi:gamma-glutamyl-gamma-aminobutyrate hydrolase PuuD